MPKIKNIIIFVVIAAVFVFVYFFFIKPSDTATPPTSVASTSPMPLVPPSTSTQTQGGDVAGDLLRLLLSVKSIKLEDAILADKAFKSLDGSHNVPLIQDGKEGRINPFAQFSADAVIVPLEDDAAPDGGSNTGATTNP